jgi:hypothetical protein
MVTDGGGAALGAADLSRTPPPAITERLNMKQHPAFVVKLRNSVRPHLKCPRLERRAIVGREVPHVQTPCSAQAGSRPY